MSFEKILNELSQGNLKKIDLTGQGIDRKKLQVLCMTIKSNPAITKLELSLGKNEIDENAVELLLDVLDQISILRLDSNPIGLNGATKLFAALNDNSSLIELDLTRCQILRVNPFSSIISEKYRKKYEAEIQRVRNIPSHQVRSTHALRSVKTFMEDPNWVYFRKELETIVNMVTHLSRSNRRDKAYYLHSIKANTLNSDLIKTVVKIISESLETNTSLQQLNLDENQIPTDELAPIRQKVERNRKLQKERSPHSESSESGHQKPGPSSESNQPLSLTHKFLSLLNFLNTSDPIFRKDIIIHIPKTNINNTLMQSFIKDFEAERTSGEAYQVIFKNNSPSHSGPSSNDHSILNLIEWIESHVGKDYPSDQFLEQLVICAFPWSAERLYDTNEHLMIGDEAYKRFYTEAKENREDISLLPKPGTNLCEFGPYFSLTFGEIVALAGDFFGIPDMPISDANDKKDAAKRFQAAYSDLFITKGSILLGRWILKVAKSIPYSRCRDIGYFLLIGKKYINISRNNLDHFLPDAKKVYAVGHTLAVKQAIKASKEPAQENKKALLRKALRLEAFACHFFTDSFAAGHMRVPRRELHEFGLRGDRYAEKQHDEDGNLGLRVSNITGKWKTFGDSQLVDGRGKKAESPEKVLAFEKVCEATKLAIQEVWDSYLDQKRHVEAKSLIPRVSYGNHNPLFKIENGRLQKRKNEKDPACNDYELFPHSNSTP